MNRMPTVRVSRRGILVRWHHIFWVLTGQVGHIAEDHLAELSQEGSRSLVLKQSHLSQGRGAAEGCSPLSGLLCLLLDCPVNWKAAGIQTILLLHGNRFYWPSWLHDCKILQNSSQMRQATSSLNAKALRAWLGARNLS